MSDDSKDNDTTPQRVGLGYSIYGGAGIGLLFGTIMGLSTTPTVATVLGSLTALLAAILGLNDGFFNNAKAVRIGSFGLLCIAGAYSGLYVRTHNLLSPSPADLKAEYLALGLTEERALDLVLIREFGFTPGQLEAGGSAPDPALASALERSGQQHSSLLFSADVEVSGCDELADTDTSLPLEEIINNFELTDGIWGEIVAGVVAHASPASQAEVLLGTRDVLCEDARSGIAMSSCNALEGVLAGPVADFGEVAAYFTAQGGAWSHLASTVGSIDMADVGKRDVALAIGRSLCR